VRDRRRHHAGVFARLTTPKGGKSSPKGKLAEANGATTSTDDGGDNTRGCAQQ